MFNYILLYLNNNYFNNINKYISTIYSNKEEKERGGRQLFALPTLKKVKSRK